MGVVSEFREFAARGNMVDLAVGVIIGAAFGKIVTSLVDDVIMPPIGLLIGGVDFSQLKFVLEEANALTGQAEVAIAYGAFLNTLFQFLIVAAVVFAMVKGLNRLRRPPVEPAEPTLTPDQELLTEIRDLLRTR
ncbi:large-conductance mechanosensitive channel protein MscL [Brevundimonas sp.]|uniref:large-conductance mechanosensitive channel protein MscL n=1 Tax=Brevundimonas sp. TaxID=1871086 RepID=UPI0025D0103C|nr:large-conductance mechanosensitive channel protein MscL [Brevundimonas sp.]